MEETLAAAPEPALAAAPEPTADAPLAAAAEASATSSLGSGKTIAARSGIMPPPTSTKIRKAPKDAGPKEKGGSTKRKSAQDPSNDDLRKHFKSKG